MALLTHTTEIDADRTAQEIARLLSRAGASAVLTEYDRESSQVTAISFKMKLNEQDIGFKLPCDWRPVYEVMYKDKKTYNKWDARYEKQLSDRRDQSVRTAWRIVKKWVEAQLAIIETKMVTTQEVFLPYAIMKDQRTLSEHMNENPGSLLASGNQ